MDTTPYNNDDGLGVVNGTLESFPPTTISYASERSLYKMAYNYARELASHQPTVTVGEPAESSMMLGNVLVDAGVPIEDETEAQDCFVQRCHEAEESARCVSPAERWINAVNERQFPDDDWAVLETAFNQAFVDEAETRYG